MHRRVAFYLFMATGCLFVSSMALAEQFYDGPPTPVPVQVQVQDPAPVVQTQPRLVINLQAFLVCTDTAKVMNVDISSESDQPQLWNVIAGEGYAGCPSNAVLVFAEVSTIKAGKFDVQFEYQAEKMKYPGGGLSPGMKGSGKMPVTWIGDSLQQTTLVPFTISNTGCEPLKVTASVVGVKGSSRTETIPFACGE